MLTIQFNLAAGSRCLASFDHVRLPLEILRGYHLAWSILVATFSLMYSGNARTLLICTVVGVIMRDGSIQTS